MKKRRWYLLTAFLSLFLLFGLFFTVFRREIETLAAAKLAHFIGRHVDFPIEIEKIRLHRLDELVLYGVQVEDREKKISLAVKSIFCSLAYVISFIVIPFLCGGSLCNRLHSLFGHRSLRLPQK